MISPLPPGEKRLISFFKITIYSQYVNKFLILWFLKLYNYCTDWTNNMNQQIRFICLDQIIPFALYISDMYIFLYLPSTSPFHFFKGFIIVLIAHHGYLIPSHLQGCCQACPVETDGQDHGIQTDPSPSCNSHCTFARTGPSPAILSPAHGPTSFNSWTA